MRFDRSTHRYPPIRDDQAALRKRMTEIASVRVRYGYRRIHVLLRREGWAVNHKRVQRLYRDEGLNLRVRRPRRHVTAARRVERSESDLGQRGVVDGLRLRRAVRWSPVSRPDGGGSVHAGVPGDHRRPSALKADAVVATVERLTYLRGRAPGKIRVDNGPEFVSRVLGHWAYQRGVTLDFLAARQAD